MSYGVHREKAGVYPSVATARAVLRAEVEGEVAFVPLSAPICIGHKDVVREKLFAGLKLEEPRDVDEAQLGWGNKVAEPLGAPSEQAQGNGKAAWRTKSTGRCEKTYSRGRGRPCL